jgi:hypothetical protein
VCFWGCTKDDICTEDTPVTPKLIVQFNDILSRNDVKAVVDLRVILIDNDDTTNVYVGTSDTLVGLPLNSNLDFTEFQMITNSADEDNLNADTISFTYSTEDIYVDRACAFKTTYSNFNANIEDEGGTNWILDAEIETTNIDNENETHLTIFH